MSLIKGVFKYALILCLLLVGLGVVLGAVMVFFPSVTIFGYKYISYSNSEQYISTLSTTETFDSVYIDAKGINISILPAITSAVSVDNDISLNGFYKTTSEQDPDNPITVTEPYVDTLEGGEKVLTYKIEIVSGLINFVSNSVKVYIPLQFSNIYTNADSTEQTLIENENRIPLKNITIISDNGNVYIDEIEATDENLDIQEKITIDGTTGNVAIKNCYAYDVDVTTTTGSISLGDILSDIPGTEFKGVKNNLNIESERGKIYLSEEVNIGKSCNITSYLSEIFLNDIKETFTYEGEAAYIHIGTVTGIVDIDSDNARIIIQKVIGTDAEVSANFGKKLSFDIEEIDASNVAISTESGSIHIGKLKSNSTDITTTSGAVTIDDLLSGVKVTTASGNIHIVQSSILTEEGNDVFNTSLRSSYLDLATASGTINLNNIVGRVDIDITNNGLVFAKFLEINANSNIVGKNGQIKVGLPIGVYQLETSSNNSVSVDVVNVQHFTTKALTVNNIQGADETSFKVSITADGGQVIAVNTMNYSA
ncbi:MAG: DUF4097 domain-containing protein [Bacteroidales bacterium]|nr:DUF4097 domain-containing protein [Bacteroidales bacterium]